MCLQHRTSHLSHREPDATNYKGVITCGNALNCVNRINRQQSQFDNVAPAAMCRGDVIELG